MADTGNQACSLRDKECAAAGRLDGKTALVTGAAKRIGRAVALALARRGADVVVHYRSSRAEAERLAGEIRDLGAQAWCLRADLADPEGPVRLFETAQRAAGPLDILINNASVFGPSTLSDMTEEDVALNIRINAWAPFVLARALAAQGREGAIVNFLDARILLNDAAHAAYHLSKRTFFTLTRMMALEFAPRIAVNGVAPGLILPPPGEDESYLKRLVLTNPLQRRGSLEGVVAAVLFLLTSDFITGQIVFVDGGLHLKGSVYG